MKPKRPAPKATETGKGAKAPKRPTSATKGRQKSPLARPVEPPVAKRATRPAPTKAPSVDDALPAPARPGANTYLYAIVPWPVSADVVRSLGPGVGDPPAPVRVVRHQSLAALVSDVEAGQMSAQGVRGMRRDMKAHAAVLNGGAAAAALLPVRFGVVLPSERALVSHVLEPQYERLEDQLARLGGAVEVTLRATYVEEEVLAEVVAARPELAGGSGAGRGRSLAQEVRLELGRQIAAAIQDLQDRDARWLVQALAPAVQDVRVGKPMSDLMVLNASFLVDRSALSRFDRKLERINEEVGHRIRFDCVGPLPPYSFVDLRL